MNSDSLYARVCNSVAELEALAREVAGDNGFAGMLFTRVNGKACQELEYCRQKISDELNIFSAIPSARRAIRMTIPHLINAAVLEESSKMLDSDNRAAYECYKIAVADFKSKLKTAINRLNTEEPQS